MKKPYFGRLLTAMVTPFREDGSVDYKAAADFAEWLLGHGTNGLLVEGSTGEPATMTMEEKLELVRAITERIGGRAPIVVGAGSNCTADTVNMVRTLEEKFSIDGFLVVGPYYNKPTQEGFYQHFAAVARATSLPIIIYNVPGRTGSNIAPETVARLARDFENIVAIKEAAGNVQQTAALYRLLPEDFSIYSGDDIQILPFMSVGACGLISVLSNTGIGATMLQEMMQAYSEGRVHDTAEMNKKIVPFANAMFLESNPIPIKEAVNLLTPFNVGAPRLPLTPISAGAKAKLESLLKEMGFLK